MKSLVITASVCYMKYLHEIKYFLFFCFSPAQDYRYWDDPSDEFREGMGSLLPLWKFQFEPMRTHAVCDVQWNPHYQDLFAVAYGSCKLSSV